MPRYRTQVAHALGREEALARLKAVIAQAGGYSDLRGAWTENAFEFTVTAQGVRLQGTLLVEADALKFDGRLPLLAMPFAGWIPRVLRKGLEGRLPAGEPSDASSVSPEADASVRADAGVAGEAAADAPVVLFLHIPKAAGQTLGEFVYEQCRAGEPRADDLLNAGVAYLNYGFLKEPGLPVPAHVRTLLKRPDLRAVIGHFWFGLHEHVAGPASYITVLRNPVERVVSLYYYAQLHQAMSLEEFLAKPPFKEVDNDQTRRIAGVDPELGGCTTATLDAARENLRRRFAVVGTTEQFDETMVLLKRKLGWRRDAFAHPRNVNASRPPTASLPRETVEAVRRWNELDFELWEYATLLLGQAIEAEGAGFGEELERYRAAAPRA